MELYLRKRPMWTPNSPRDVIIRVTEHPEVLEDPRLWPYLLKYRQALTTIIDEPDAFSRQTRSLAWRLQALDPRQVPSLKSQDRYRGQRYLKNAVDAIRVNAQMGIGSLWSDTETKNQFLKIIGGKTRSNPFDEALRQLFARVGADVILSQPELTGTQLLREVRRRVRDEIGANMLPRTAPESGEDTGMQPGERTEDTRARKDHRLRQTISRGPCWGRYYNKHTDKWERDRRPRTVPMVVLESDLGRTTLDDSEPTDRLDRAGKPLYHDHGNLKAHEAAREAMAKLDGIGTDRQWAALEAIAQSTRHRRKPVSVADRQAARRLRRQCRHRLGDPKPGE